MNLRDCVGCEECETTSSIQWCALVKHQVESQRLKNKLNLKNTLIQIVKTLNTHLDDDLEEVQDTVVAVTHHVSHSHQNRVPETHEIVHFLGGKVDF